MPYKDPVKAREYAKAYYKIYNEKYRDRINGYYKKYRENNRNKMRASDKKRYWEDPKVARFKGRERLKNKRLKVIDKLGSNCNKCGMSDIRVLQIDHVNGGGYKERNMGLWAYLNKVLDDTTGIYQLLCANCNWVKRYENKEYNYSQWK